MPDVIPTLEIERVENLINNFDWKVVKQEITETDILLTIKKPKDTSLTETSPGAS